MKPVRVNKAFMPVLVLVALLGSVFVAKAAGAWQTSGRGDVMLDENGQPDPAGIKGWMTLADIAGTYGLPLEAVYALIGAGDEVPPETALKDLEKLLPGTEVSAVRLGVAAYLAGTWSPDDGPDGADGTSPAEVVPAATPIPEASGVSPEDHVPLGQGQGQGDSSGSGFVLPQDGSRLPASDIRGRMTLQEVADFCQVPLDVLAAELGLPAGFDVHLRLSELAGQLGIEVQAVRDAVAAYQAEP